eukprot:GHVP01065392.1.p2 GENE.GHVP01065392.1~~GHVP01065392.1.p2  ORF type:complete len:234 (-),score=40.28 GHVP01065392.1:1036-1737(-)
MIRILYVLFSCIICKEEIRSETVAQMQRRSNILMNPKAQVWTCSYLSNKEKKTDSEARSCYKEACDLLQKKLDNKRCRTIGCTDEVTADVLLLKQTVEVLSKTSNTCAEEEFTPLMNLLANILLIKADRCVFCVEDFVQFANTVLGRTRKTKMYCAQDKDSNIYIYKNKDGEVKIMGKAGGIVNKPLGVISTGRMEGSIEADMTPDDVNEILTPINGSMDLNRETCRKAPTCL